MSLNESLDSGISFRLALNAGNNNMIQLKGLQSAYYPQTAFYPRSAFYMQSAGYVLHWRQVVGWFLQSVAYPGGLINCAKNGSILL